MIPLQEGFHYNREDINLINTASAHDCLQRIWQIKDSFIE